MQIEAIKPELVQVFILAGGRGTRSADPETPKAIQEISKGLLNADLQLQVLENSGFKNVCFLLGFKSELMIEFIEFSKSRYPSLRISFSIDSSLGSTAKSVSEAVTKFASAENFLVLLGDTAIFAPLDKYLQTWAKLGGKVGVFCHPNLHLKDSDRLLLNGRSEIVGFVQKGHALEHERQFLIQAATGAMFFQAGIVEMISPDERDITKALIEASISQSSGVGIVCSHYFKDTGTPERLEQVRKDWSSGAIRRRGGQGRAALFLDRDGTLIRDLGTDRKILEDSDIASGLGPSIRECNNLGVPVFVVTNQPGIAKGQISEGDVFTVHNSLNDWLSKAESFIDGITYCPHYPEAGFEGEVFELKVKCKCRKPGSGMLESLEVGHNIDLSKSFMIGDTWMDEEAALSAGCNFILASWDGQSGIQTSLAIRQALGELLSANHAHTV